MTYPVRLFFLVALSIFTACDSGSSSDDAATPPDIVNDGDPQIDVKASSDVNAANCVEKAKACASKFGSLFTKTNGRADGTLVAVVRPADTQCALPNSTHVVLQLSIQDQVHRLVVSVNDVAVTSVASSLVGPPYAEGWHPDMDLDYPTDFDVHSEDFTSMSMDEAVDFICAPLVIGAPVSVYAYCDGTYPGSAHQVHRNNKYPDGAIVIDPKAAKPTYLLFRYEDQLF